MLGARTVSRRGPADTVASLGEQGVETVFEVIYPLQVALVGFRDIVERLLDADGLTAPSPVIKHGVALGESSGHRRPPGRIVPAKIDRLLQEPQSL